MNNPNNADELLCKYLQDVSRHLKSVSPIQREEELRELKSHLEQIVALETANGVDEMLAAQTAIARFGSARKVGRALAKSHRSHESWIQAIVTLVACVCVQWMWSALMWKIRSWIDLEAAGLDGMWFFSMMLLPFVLVGMTAKALSPRRAPMVLLTHSAAVAVLMALFMPTFVSSASSHGSAELKTSIAQQNLTELVLLIGAASLFLTSAGAFFVGSASWLRRRFSRAS